MLRPRKLKQSLHHKRDNKKIMRESGIYVESFSSDQSTLLLRENLCIEYT